MGVRCVCLLLQGTLLLTDVALLSGCAWLSLQHMPSVLILFGFEYAILAVAALATVCGAASLSTYLARCAFSPSGTYRHAWPGKHQRSLRFSAASSVFYGWVHRRGSIGLL